MSVFVFGNDSHGMIAVEQDGFSATGTIAAGTYSVLVVSQDPVVTSADQEL
jgi:hypothetical protein